MAIRLLAATALLIAPAGALATQVFLGADRGAPPEEQSARPALPSFAPDNGASGEDHGASGWIWATGRRATSSASGRGVLSTSMRAWLDRATQANKDLDEKARTVMQELADTARKEADPGTKKEQELQMLEDMLKDWDTDNESSIDDTSRRMAAIAFRRAIRNYVGRPARAERRRRRPAQDPTPEQDLDLKLDGYLNTWGDEADSATQDMEKHVSPEDSDPGEAMPKNLEEKILEWTQDLMDGTNPTDGTEMTVTQQRTEAEAHVVEAMRAWVKEAQAQAFADLAGALAQVERRPKRKAVRPASRGRSEADSKTVEAIRAWMADSEMVGAIKAWMAEAIKASHVLEKSTSHEEIDLGEAKPKREEEKSLESVAGVVDEVDPKNASEMAELADALAQVERRPKRQAAGRSLQIASVTDVDSKLAVVMRIWMDEALKASQDLQRALKDVRHGMRDLEEGKPKGEEEKNLTVADLVDEVNPRNASEIAVIADARAQVQRRSQRTATHHESQDLRSWVTKAVEAMRSDGRHDEDKVVEAMMRKPRGQSDAHAKVVEAMRSWMVEAAKASLDLEEDARYEESNLQEAVPKGQGGQDSERVENLNDEVDPQTASELDDLAAAIAQARALQRRLKRRAGPEGKAKGDTRRATPTLPTSSTDRIASRADPTRTADRGAPVGEAVKKELKMLEEMWKRYGPESPPSATDVAIEELDADTNMTS